MRISSTHIHYHVYASLMFFGTSFCFRPTAPCPVNGQHSKQHRPILLTPTLQIFISTDKIPCEPSFLQAEQLQGSQPFFIRESLQGPNPFCHPLLDRPKKFPVFLEVRNPKLGTVLWMLPHCFGQLCLTLIVVRPSLHPWLLISSSSTVLALVFAQLFRELSTVDN